MIKVNQLRIGNLVWEDYGGVYEIENIHNIGFVDYKKHGMTAIGRCPIDSIYPITLTEEWLLNLGFNRPKDFIDGLWIETKIISIHKSWLDDEVKLMLRYIDFNIELWNNYCFSKIKIEYVHQLQNLYFALTGEELTIKN